MKAVFVLMLLVGHQALACKMTPLGSSYQSMAAITKFVLENEQQDTLLRAVYLDSKYYVYETKRQTKCIATAVRVNVGSDCSHTVVPLNDKINCRLK